MSEAKTKSVHSASSSRKRPARRRKPGTTEFLIWDIPTPVKREFKAKCAERGDDMKTAIIKFMGEYARLR